MANALAPRGLQAVRRIDGDGEPTTRTLPLSSGYTTALYKGAPLLWNGTARTVKVCNTSLLLATNFAGICAEYYPGSAAATKTRILTWPLLQNVFSVQVDGGATTNTVKTYIGKCVGCSTKTGYTVATGSTSTGYSKMAVRYASIKTTVCTTSPFRVLDIDRSIGHLNGTYMKLFVTGGYGYAGFELQPTGLV